MIPVGFLLPLLEEAAARVGHKQALGICSLKSIGSVHDSKETALHYAQLLQVIHFYLFFQDVLSHHSRLTAAFQSVQGTVQI